MSDGIEYYNLTNDVEDVKGTTKVLRELLVNAIKDSDEGHCMIICIVTIKDGKRNLEMCGNLSAIETMASYILISEHMNKIADELKKAMTR